MADDELVKRYQSWDTVDLVRASTVNAASYEPEALAAISAELERRGPEEREASRVAEARERALALSERWVGVKGWLLVLILMMVINSFKLLAGGFGAILLASAAFRTIALLEGAVGVWGLFTAWTLALTHPRAPFYAILWFLASLLPTLGLSLFLYLRTGNWDGMEIWIRLLWAATWIAYLRGSRRVRATYGRPDTGEDLVSEFS